MCPLLSLEFINTYIITKFKWHDAARKIYRKFFFSFESGVFEHHYLLVYSIQLLNDHSFISLSYDRSKASSKASSPHSAI